MHTVEAFNKDGVVDHDYNFEEWCPHCDKPIAITIDNDDFTHYEVTCPYCGEKVMLCTLCRGDFGIDIDCADDKCGCPIKKAEMGLIPFPKRLEAGEDCCVSRSVYEEKEAIKTNADHIREMNDDQLTWIWFYIRNEVVKGERNDHFARAKIFEWLSSSET